MDHWTLFFFVLRDYWLFYVVDIHFFWIFVGRSIHRNPQPNIYQLSILFQKQTRCFFNSVQEPLSFGLILEHGKFWKKGDRGSKFSLVEIWADKNTLRTIRTKNTLMICNVDVQVERERERERERFETLKIPHKVSDRFKMKKIPSIQWNFSLLIEHVHFVQKLEQVYHKSG